MECEGPLQPSGRWCIVVCPYFWGTSMIMIDCRERTSPGRGQKWYPWGGTKGEAWEPWAAAREVRSLPRWLPIRSTHSYGHPAVWKYLESQDPRYSSARSWGIFTCVLTLPSPNLTSACLSQGLMQCPCQASTPHSIPTGQVSVSHHRTAQLAPDSNEPWTWKGPVPFKGLSLGIGGDFFHCNKLRFPQNSEMDL